VTHPDLDRLTLWIHGFLEAGEGAALESHLSGCAECRAAAAAVREEATLLSREIARPERLLALKTRLLEAASVKRVSRGLLWQVPVAAAVLLGLVGVLFSGGARHSLVEGRATLNDGREIAAPSDLAASETWQLRAVDRVRVRLMDQSTVDLAPAAEISLSPGDERGVRPELSMGEAEFSVAPGSHHLTIRSPAGRVLATDGKCSLRIVFRDEEGGDPVKKTFAGALVTVLAGSMSLSSAGGVAQADAGQSAVLARAEAPLFLSSPQDKQEDLLRRLEQLAARVAKLEGEVTQLEEKNRQLKLQVAGNGAPGAWGLAPGQSAGGVRIIQSNPGAAPGSTIIIETKEESERKSDRTNLPKEK